MNPSQPEKEYAASHGPGAQAPTEAHEGPHELRDDDLIASVGSGPQEGSKNAPRPKSAKPPAPPAQWCSVEHAAAVLGLQVVTLRRAFERNARRGAGGVVEASVDGMLARKIGRLWRVSLGSWAQSGTK